MSKRLLFGAIALLMITNITTLLFWNKDDGVDMDFELDGGNEKKVTKKDRIAKVGDTEILYEDWLNSLQSVYGQKLLEEMINKELVKQLVEENNIQINEKLIEKEISFLATMQGVMSESEIEREEKKWREDILYRFQLEEILANGVNIPEEDIKSHYNMYPNQYDFDESMQFSHIVVDNTDTADKVIEELDAGASFQLLAQEYSIDDETKNNGGYLGYFTKASEFIPNNYIEVAEDMEEYSYSDPFPANNGIAIVYLHRNLPSINFTYDEIKAHIRNELALKELEQPLTPDPLWEQFDIEWIYEK